jgi:16S rRNA (cytidine1402-2'-O)-methyltransferase
LIDALSPPILKKISQELHDQQHKPGLYVVATPIGNIFDISLRAIYILKKSKYIFAEDTRQSKKILGFYDIVTPLISCYEHNEMNPSVISKIQTNEIYALISDAGTPLISDPGYKIINWCLAHQVDVIPIPGASALIAGLSAAGLPTNNFTFYGFLSPKSQARRLYLSYMKNARSTAVFLESPGRILNTLNDMLEILGDRRGCVCREMTKIFEEFKRGTLSELIDYFSINKPRGEFTIIISGSEETYSDEEILKMSTELSRLLSHESLKNSVEKIFQKYNHLSKKLIYKTALEIKREKNK